MAAILFMLKKVSMSALETVHMFLVTPGSFLPNSEGRAYDGADRKKADIKDIE